MAKTPRQVRNKCKPAGGKSPQTSRFGQRLSDATADFDSVGEISQDVADGDYADELAVEKDRDVAVAANVHFVEGEGDLVVCFERYRVRGHELRDRAIEEFCRVDVQLHECVSLAEDAD